MRAVAIIAALVVLAAPGCRPKPQAGPKIDPALATMVGYVGLDERMSALQVWGAAVILAGVLMINWPATSPAVRAAPPEP